MGWSNFVYGSLFCHLKMIQSPRRLKRYNQFLDFSRAEILHQFAGIRGILAKKPEILSDGFIISKSSALSFSVLLEKSKRLDEEN